jgi:hypothetical protein
MVQAEDVKIFLTLQRIVIQARYMSYKGEPYRRIAGILDDMDHLFNLILDKEDRTSAFRTALEEITQKYQCKSVMVIFDE